jgi:hypothetical protein
MGIPVHARCYSCQYYAENYYADGYFREAKPVQDCACGEREDWGLPYEEVCDHYEYDPESEDAYD